MSEENDAMIEMSKRAHEKIQAAKVETFAQKRPGKTTIFRAVDHTLLHQTGTLEQVMNAFRDALLEGMEGE